MRHVDRRHGRGRLLLRPGSSRRSPTRWASPRRRSTCTPKGSNWLWSWALAIPASSSKDDAAKKFITWATSKDYVKLVGEERGLGRGAPRHAQVDLRQRASIQEAAPFAEFVLKAIDTADPINTTAKPKPYIGVQYAGIPEFQAIGTQVGQHDRRGAHRADAGRAGAEDRAVAAPSATMKQAGYPK